MKKDGIINRELGAVIVKLGHTDAVTICDCGLPLPEEKKVIDLSIKKGFPGLIETLQPLLEEIVVESAVLAEEIIKANPQMHQRLLNLLKNVKVKYVKHEDFKAFVLEKSKVIVRTGEATPYSNVILFSGVDF
ncbi:ribose pyranase [Kosmotoga arenicorallina S304]|uniref:D-ribose pyranase n=1 Tax=Kosmotoga arenicorallina S304 TaxID=1453497 RepID=A0A176JUT9_9BACT|nr:D-ribose pyranase [Kosmotoga arenicorallina]OAA27215.1 ribose pyranase [Kosmotoga arenicorallina S304]